MKDLIIIAAIGKNNELGLKNDLIWHLPGDLKFFKEKTMNKSIVMGINTFKSLPKLLKGRKHIVVTHQNIDNPEVKVVSSIEELMEYLDTIDDDVYVIGGASIYRQLMPYANKMVLTHVDDTHEADVYFPEIKEDEWDKEFIKSNEDNGVNYKHYTYTKKMK